MGYTLSFPLQSFAGNNETSQIDSEQDSIKLGKITADDEEKIPLYKNAEQIEAEVSKEVNVSPEEDFESSNIVFYLKNNDVVTVIGESEFYSFIEFVQEKNELSELDETEFEETKVLQGYIENKYLEVSLDNDITDDSNQNEQVSENNSDLDSDDDSELENDSENNQEEPVSEDSNDLDSDLTDGEVSSETNLDSNLDNDLEDDIEINQDDVAN